MIDLATRDLVLVLASLTVVFGVFFHVGRHL